MRICLLMIARPENFLMSLFLHSVFLHKSPMRNVAEDEVCLNNYTAAFRQLLEGSRIYKFTLSSVLTGRVRGPWEKCNVLKKGRCPTRTVQVVAHKFPECGGPRDLGPPSVGNTSIPQGALEFLDWSARNL